MNKRIILYGAPLLIGAVLMVGDDSSKKSEYWTPVAESSFVEECMTQTLGIEAPIVARSEYCGCVGADFLDVILKQSEYKSSFEAIVTKYDSLKKNARSKSRAIASQDKDLLEADTRVQKILRPLGYKYRFSELRDQEEKFNTMIEVEWKRSMKRCFENLDKDSKNQKTI